MPRTVFGLPTHALLVHGTVVLVPLAALAVLVHALWPAARRRLGVVTPVLAGLAVVLVPLSTESGESLERMVGESELVERHAELADGMLPWAVGLFVVAVAVWLLGRRPAAAGARGVDADGTAAGRSGMPRWVPIAVAVLAVVAVAGTVQQVVRVGHAGAEATWEDVVHSAPADGGDDD